MKNFIEIAKFTYEYEYSVLRLLLEKEAIRFYFKNETILGITPFYSNALGGIVLFVHKKDEQKALKILEDFNSKSNLQIV